MRPTVLTDIPSASNGAGADEKVWWKDSVVYQCYIASFADSNGDGLGDIRGIIEKLPYLAWLGVGVLWVTPMFASPMVDIGYDVSD